MIKAYGLQLMLPTLIFGFFSQLILQIFDFLKHFICKIQTRVKTHTIWQFGTTRSSFPTVGVYSNNNDLVVLVDCEDWTATYSYWCFYGVVDSEILLIFLFKQFTGISY